jgi:multiple sugar transport system substrate-binding protein
VDAALAGKSEATADPFIKIISEQVVKYGKQEPAYPWDIALAFGTAIESAMKGSADIPTSLKTAEKAINDVIEKQQLKGTQPVS